MFEELALANGFSIDTVLGRERYVTRDNRNRALIGPVRHRLSRRKRQPVYTGSRLVTAEELATMTHQQSPLAGVAQQISENLRKALPPAPPPPRRSWKQRVLDALRNEDAHDLVRNCAITVSLVSVAVMAVSLTAGVLTWLL